MRVARVCTARNLYGFPALSPSIKELRKRTGCKLILLPNELTPELLMSSEFKVAVMGFGILGSFHIPVLGYVKDKTHWVRTDLPEVLEPNEIKILMHDIAKYFPENTKAMFEIMKNQGGEGQFANSYRHQDLARRVFQGISGHEKSGYKDA